jgi:hypothetical protein
MAQNIIKGKIYDENKQTISGANILLYDLSEKERITYTLSNAEGYYEIFFKSNQDSLLLRVSLLGYKKQEQIVRNQTQNIDFTLQEEIEEIREIVVKAPPVVQSGDTLIYKPSNFANANMRCTITNKSKINNVLLSQTFRPNGSVLVIGIEKDNTPYAHLLNGRIGKSFFEQRASVVVRASYSQFVLPQIINQNLQNVSIQGATWGLILEKDWQTETNAESIKFR